MNSMKLQSFAKLLSTAELHIKLINFFFISKPARSFSMDAGDAIKIDKNPSVIKEGSAEILESPGNTVFYNPVQEFNRDLSILALQVFSEEFHGKNSESTSQKTFRILEALSATGLRSIRYAKEISGVSKIIANDISQSAVENIKKNIIHNQVENIVEASQSNAKSIMFNNSEPSQRFEVVDLDPYGSPTVFLDSAVQCVADGGMLMVTCTDLAILCGNFAETCYVKYGALSLRCQSCHEMAIRIALQCIQSHASRYKRYIVPVLSVSADFYIRIFVKVFTSAVACKDVTRKLSLVYLCTSCGTTVLQPLGILKKSKKNDNHLVHGLPHVPSVGSRCEHCGGKFHMGGPIWNDKTCDPEFVDKMLQSRKIFELGTSKRLLGMLSLIREELHDVPLYYVTPSLFNVVKSNMSPIMEFRSAILNGGYRVSFSHAARSSLKTDAPMSFIWDILRTIAKNQNINKPKNLEPGTPAYVILNTPIKNEIDFSLRPEANPLSREMKLTRYQENPQPYWGPGSKSTVMSMDERRKQTISSKKALKKRKLDSECKSSNEPNFENTTEGVS